MTMIVGFALCFLAIVGAYMAGRWHGWDKGWNAGIDAASGKAVTPLRPKVEPRVTRRGGDGAA